MQSSGEWANSGMPLDGIWDDAERSTAISELVPASYLPTHDLTLHSCRERSHPRNTGNDVFSPLTFSDYEQPGGPSKPPPFAENLDELDVRSTPSVIYRLHSSRTLQYSMILSMHRFVGFSKV